MKPIIWCGDSLDRVRELPEPARRKAGQQLNRLQHGHEPQDWKPMRTVGLGVCELRIHANGEYRVLYFAKFGEAVYVLHAFTKKSRKTPTRELVLASNRYLALIETRKRLHR